MCGIAGVLRRDGCPADSALLQRMSDVLVHRGPDDQGLYTSGGIGLVHRRLSIIDLSSGHQPMMTSDRALTIVFNGEIYNYAEIRQELQTLGHSFQTHSDTEVILEAYRQWGRSCVQKFRGMFAIALWDEQTRSLWLCRDRVGIKPLFYYHGEDELLFGSELKAILQESRIPRRIHDSSLLEYLQYGYVPAPRTIYTSIMSLAPGHDLLISPDNWNAKPVRYWQCSFVSDPLRNQAEWLEQISEALTQSVKFHLVSDVPVGAFLSGGVDSGTVCYHMAQVRSSIQTFTMGFINDERDELPLARRVAERIGSRHVEGVIPMDALEEIVSKLIWHYDQPFADSSAIPTFSICQEMAKSLKVVLSGDGGDEVFAGYGRYSHMMEMASSGYHRILGATLLRNILPDFRGVNVIKNRLTDPRDRFYDTVGIFSRRQLTRIVRHSVRYRHDLFDAYYAQVSHDDVLSQLQNADIHTYLPEDCLVKVDRASMAHSLEVRVPLLDHTLLELTAQIPSALRMKNGTTKYLLKTLMRDKLPPQILESPKRGFSIPMNRWLREDPTLLTRMSETILKSNMIAEYLKVNSLSNLVAEHRSGKKNHGSRLWSLYYLSRWFDEYFQRM